MAEFDIGLALEPDHPENKNLTSMMPARFRSCSDPSVMILESGVPSIHSVTRT